MNETRKIHEEAELNRRRHLVAQRKMNLADNRDRSKVSLERSRLIMVQELKKEEQERRKQISNVREVMQA